MDGVVGVEVDPDAGLVLDEVGLELGEGGDAGSLEEDGVAFGGSEVGDGVASAAGLVDEAVCARAAGEVEWKQKGLTKAMKDRGFDNKQSNGMQWIGLKAIKTVGDFVDENGNVKTIEVDRAPDPPPRPSGAADDEVGRAYARDGPPRPPDDFDPGPDDGWAL